MWKTIQRERIDSSRAAVPATRADAKLTEKQPFGFARVEGTFQNIEQALRARCGQLAKMPRLFREHHTVFYSLLPGNYRVCRVSKSDLSGFMSGKWRYPTSIRPTQSMV
jgi:hypothetical protein